MILIIAIKTALLDEMERQGVSAAELSRRLGKSPQSVNRILTLNHPTKIDTLAEAFDKLGKRLTFEISDIK